MSYLLVPLPLSILVLPFLNMVLRIRKIDQSWNVIIIIFSDLFIIADWELVLDRYWNNFLLTELQKWSIDCSLYYCFRRWNYWYKRIFTFTNLLWVTYFNWNIYLIGLCNKKTLLRLPLGMQILCFCYPHDVMLLLNTLDYAQNRISGPWYRNFCIYINIQWYIRKIAILISISETSFLLQINV